MLQWEAVRGNYLLVVLYRLPENPPCRDRALWYVTTSNPHIQWKQSVVEIAQADVVWARWDKFALLKTKPALYFFQPCLHISAKQIQNILYILNIDNPAMCVKSEIAIRPLSILFAHKAFKFQTIAPLVRAYGTGQVKCSDLANSPKTDESRVHVRRHWVCWHKQYPECGSDRHPAPVSLLLSY